MIWIILMTTILILMVIWTRSMVIWTHSMDHNDNLDDKYFHIFNDNLNQFNALDDNLLLLVLLIIILIQYKWQ